jgi:predicted metallopeptidase
MTLQFEVAWDIKQKIVELVYRLNLTHIDINNVTCFRSKGSRTRAYARIWEFPRIWQLALNQPPHYIIEIVSNRFDKLSNEEKEKVLIHELMHIPKNFSGNLRPHGEKVSKFLDKKIEKMHEKYRNNKFITKN